MNRTPYIQALYLTLLILGTTATLQSAHPCGFCANDKAASVYSYDSILWAQTHGGRYLVAVVVGPQTAGEFAHAVASLKRAPGVAGQSLKSAFAQHAVSFALASGADPDALERRFSQAKDGFRIQLLHGNWAAQSVTH